MLLLLFHNRYIIQEERAYSWADDGDIEEKPFLRREGRDDRGDRYVSENSVDETYT